MLALFMLWVGLLVLVGLGASPAYGLSTDPYRTMADAEFWKIVKGLDAENFASKAYEAGLGDGAAARQTRWGLWQARVAGGALPTLRLAGRLSLGVSAFEVGWKIGRTIDNKWLHIRETIAGSYGTVGEIGTYVANGSSTKPAYVAYSTGASWTGTQGWILNYKALWGYPIANWYAFFDPTSCSPSDCFPDLYGAEDTAAVNVATEAYAWFADHLDELDGLVETVPCSTSASFGYIDGSVNYYLPTNVAGRPSTCYALMAEASVFLGGLAADVFKTWDGETATNTTSGFNPGAGTGGQVEAARVYLDLGDGSDATAAKGAGAINHVAEPGTYPDPSLDTNMVPDCSGLTVAECVAELETAGFTETPTELELGIATADLEQPAGAVVSTDPAGGATVELDTVVVLSVNPDPLPLVLLAPVEGPDGETYAQYVARLEAAGYLGTASELVLTDATLSPEYGPDAVVTTTPAPGTRVWPGDAITVRVNPQTAPLPAGAGACAGYLTADPDLTPLDGHAFADKFPFAIFSWIAAGFGAWEVAAVAPSITIPFIYGDLVIDFADFEPAMVIVRPVVLAGALILMVWGLATGLLGLRGQED